MSNARNRALRALLPAIARLDRWRLAAHCWTRTELEVHPDASSNLCVARFVLAPGSRLSIGAGVVSERNRGDLSFELGPGAEVTIGSGTWLSTRVAPVRIVAFPGARLEVGPDCYLNGCHVSAKQSLKLGRRVFVGIGTRIFDSDQHDFDSERSERQEPVKIGDHTWIAADVTVLRGVEIGEHSVVGTRSVVTRSIPPHTVAFGAPATPRGTVGDRSRTR